jgi:hypothetical protein
MPDTPRAPSPGRLFVIAIAAAVVGFVITLSFGFADHAPAPHGVRLAVTAPPDLVRELTAGLAHAAPGGFTILTAPTAQAVASDVRSQQAAGGLTAGPAGPVTIVTAAAAGTSQQQAITTALSAAAGVLHRPVLALDAVPLPPGDHAGLSAFVFELGLLLPSVIASVGLFLLGARLRLWWRVTAAALFALLTACGSVLALHAIYWAPWSSSSSATPSPAGRCPSRSCPTGSASSPPGSPTAPSSPLPATSPTSRPPAPPIPSPS